MAAARASLPLILDVPVTLSLLSESHDTVNQVIDALSGARFQGPRR
jgi:hypothetical protein